MLPMTNYIHLSNSFGKPLSAARGQS